MATATAVQPPVAQTVKQVAAAVLVNAQAKAAAAPAAAAAAPVPAKVVAVVTDKYKMLKVSAGVIAVSAVCFLLYRNRKA